MDVCRILPLYCIFLSMLLRYPHTPLARGNFWCTSRQYSRRAGEQATNVVESVEAIKVPLRRNAITAAEKSALRRYRQSLKKVKQKELILWFEATFGKRITQPSVSEALSKKYRWLDNGTVRPDLKKRRYEQYPDLERALYAWCDRLRRTERTLTISGESLLRKTREIFRSLPQYQGQPMPSFSRHWLTDFKARYGMKQRPQRGETGSVGDGVVDAESSDNKVVRDTDEQIVRQAIGADASAPELDSNGEVGSVEGLSRITASTAVQMLARLRLHEEQADDCDHEWIARLDRHAHVLRQRQWRVNESIRARG